MHIYLQGLTMGLAYVAPIGAQNLFVIQSAMGPSRRRAFLTALIVTFFDVTLALACFFGIGALMDASIAASRGIGKSIAPTVMVILGSCVFRVIWIYTVFAYFHTVPSLYLLYIFSWVITGIAECIYFRAAYKKSILKAQIW